MKRKLTVQEKRKIEPGRQKPFPKKPDSRKIEVQARYIGKVTGFNFLAGMREWHRHKTYETTEDAEKAVAKLNEKDGLQFGKSPKQRCHEYRLKPERP